MHAVKPQGSKVDLLCKIARAGQSKTNACRNLHALIDKHNQLFPVRIDCELVRVAFRKPYYRQDQIYWPVLRMGEWVDALLREAPEMILAGHTLEDQQGWEAVFATFWMKYEQVNPGHPVYSDFDEATRRKCVPYFLHGDEGRGQCRKPLMIESFQPCVSHRGLEFTNESTYLDVK